ncbi:MAG: iron-containing alcohol dehydrogenase [Verrucomicrobiota bacterium]
MAGSAPIRFEFATATRIVFGAGALREAALAAKSFGKRALIVTGSSVERAEPLLHWLTQEHVHGAPFAVRGEPTTHAVVQGVQRAREAECDVVIGFGGGSAIDAAKAIAAMLTNEGELLDYLEVIGRGKALTRQSAPFIAVPTTAGAGAEVTRNAVIASPEHRVKASLRSPLMLARVAVVDPELTHHLPPALTASTGLDALTQLIEPYVSCRANPLTDGLCVEGMRRVARSLARAFEHGQDKPAREDMALASLFGGLCLANAGLGAVHGFAAPIGGMFPAPHGAVCAALLPHVMEANLHALRQRHPGHVAIQRYEEVARILTGVHTTTAEGGIAWVAELCQRLKIPPLRGYEMTARDIPATVEKAMQASSMKANPIPLTHEELEGILGKAI